MATIKFYYLYDRDTHKGKVVIKSAVHNGYTVETTHLVDQINCQVPTRSKRSESNPKFVVEGECKDYLLDNSTGEMIIVLL